MSSAVVSLSDLKELLGILAPLAGKWEVFLIALGVSGDERDVIQAQHAHSPNYPMLCLVDGVERWVKSRESPTYGKLIEALNSKFLTDKLLAAKVEDFATLKSSSGVLSSPNMVIAATTTCQPTSQPEPCSSTPEVVKSEPIGPSQSSGEVSKGPLDCCPYNKAQALAKRNDLQKCFISQAVGLKVHLQETFTDQLLPEFLNGFILEHPCSVKDEHEKFFHRTKSEITRATSFDELFMCLNTYWDPLNYTLLQAMIDAHGTEYMIENMECFVIDLREFRRKTKLKVFWQLDRQEMRRKPPPSFRQFVTKHSITGDSTLEDVENIRLEVTDEFHLSKCALLLVHVVEGSVIITWFVPSSAIALLKEGLGKPEVLAKLHIDSVEFIEEDSIADTAVDYDAELALSLHEQYNPEDLDSGPIFRSAHEKPLKGTFLKAAASGDTARVAGLGLRVDVNTSGEFGRTAIMFAGRNGHADTVQALAALGADMHIKDKFGWTALMFTAANGHTDTVQTLVELGADIHVQDADGQSALMYAAWHGHTDTVQTLAALGADIDIQDADGQTDTVKALEALGADIQVQDVDGNTALFLALNDNLYSDTAKALIAAGSKLNLQEKVKGWTALFFAAKHGSLPLVKLMLERGADPTIRDKEGSTAYDVASVYGHEDVMEELVKYTPPPHAEASPPPPESTTSSSTAQTKRDRVYRAVRTIAERIERVALPGRARKETGGPLPGPEEGLIFNPSQKSSKPGGP